MSEPTVITTYYTQSGTLTANQIMNLYTTPIEIIAAGGANTAILLDGVSMILRYNSTPYTGGDNIVLFSGNQSLFKIMDQSCVCSAQSCVSYSTPYINDTYTLASLTNQPIYIQNQLGGNFANGDSTIIYNVSYFVANLT